MYLKLVFSEEQICRELQVLSGLALQALFGEQSFAVDGAVRKALGFLILRQRMKTHFFWFLI